MSQAVMNPRLYHEVGGLVGLAAGGGAEIEATAVCGCCGAPAPTANEHRTKILHGEVAVGVPGSRGFG